MIAGACSSEDGSPETVAPETVAPGTIEPASSVVAGGTETTSPDGSDVAPVDARFTLRPSVEQLHVIDADAGTPVDLLSGTGAVVGSGRTDDAGAHLFRSIPPGRYRVRLETDPPQLSDEATVTAIDDVPEASLYTGQVLDQGFGYITTRDGTLLSANVVLPGPVDAGPYPTVVEYSGYAPSSPDDTTLAQLYNALGYAYVGVNIRGTGCSDGAFGFFEPIQSLDGYDVIETVAAQPWVAHGMVGMVGISYPGISQLFVARTQPPHLAAITPLAVLDDSYRSTLYPGGILNTGFAVPWAEDRQREAEAYGQAWTEEQVASGDEVCAANQELRGQNQDLLGMIEAQTFYDPAVADPIAPVTFVDDITVPVFLAGAWQDEQTGGRFPAMLDQFSSSPHLYATMVNGTHLESFSLSIFPRYVEFLDLYVARRTPSLAAASAVAPLLVGGITGVEGLTLPAEDRFAGMPYEEALAAFEADPPVRILFEEGAADGAPPGTPVARFEAGFDAWPIVDAVASPWYLTADGVLRPEADDTPASATAPTSYTADPDAVPETSFEGSSGGVWAAQPEYDWERNPAGTAAVWTTPLLEQDTVVIGAGSVDLWVRSSAPDTDFEVTLSEIRPDGTEVYVQSGWLRASHRALADGSTELRPLHTHAEADAEPLPEGELTPLRIELLPVAHAFRAGSQLRLTVDSPGGNRPIWAFDTISDGETVEIAHDGEHQSRIVLPVVSGIDVPAGLPACGALRGQPCRAA